MIIVIITPLEFQEFQIVIGNDQEKEAWKSKECYSYLVRWY